MKSGVRQQSKLRKKGLGTFCNVSKIFVVQVQKYKITILEKATKKNNGISVTCNGHIAICSNLRVESMKQNY